MSFIAFEHAERGLGDLQEAWKVQLDAYLAFPVRLLI